MLFRSRKKYLSTALGIALCLLSFYVRGAELREMAVEFADDRYHLKSETYMDVGQESLYLVLADFELFEQFTSAIVESSNTEPDELGRPGFFARMEGCVLLFCKSFVRDGYLVLTPHEEIVAVANPQASDFKFSRESWRLVPEGEGTIMIYDFELEPAFFVPPVIGPFYIQHALRSGAERAVNRIEALAFSEELRRKAAKNVDSE